MLRPNCTRPRPQRHSLPYGRALQAGNGLGRDLRCRMGGATMTPTSSTAWNDLGRWIKDNGGRILDLDLAECKLGEATVRGIVARKRFTEGAIMMTVPLRTVLQDYQLPPPYPDAPWNIAMACKLIKEYRSKSRSWARPYLELLPAAQLTPLVFTSDEIAAIQYMPAVRAVKDYKTAVKAAWTSLQEAGYDFTHEEVMWGMTMVQSRALRIPELEARVMLPGIDMLNHGGPLCNAKLGVGDSVWGFKGDDSIHLIAKTDIEAGQQILWHYGDRSNDDFFVYHGFSIGDNSFDDVILFDNLKDLTCWFHDTFLEPSSKMHPSKQSPPWKISSPASQSWASLPVPVADTKEAKEAAVAKLVQELEPIAAAASKQAAADCQESHKAGTADTLLTSIRPARSGMRSPPRRVRRPFRLHYRDWGAGDCTPDMPELLVRADGLIDCRLAAAMEKLYDRFLWGSQKLPTWQSVVALRCQELLDSFSTSLGEDKLLLGAGRSDGGFGLALQYRKHKKEVLHKVLKQCQKV